MRRIISFIVAIIAFSLFVQAFIYIGIPAIAVYGAYRLIRYYRKEKYFKSESFLEHREKIDSLVSEYNEISDYLDTLPYENTFSSNSDKYKYSHLARSENTSLFNITRDKYKKELHSDYVCQTSLQGVRKASEEPIKYLCKYFNIEATEENLQKAQEIGENISKFTNAYDNLKLREQQILTDFNPPKFIVKHYREELFEKLQIDIPEITIKYPEYVFEYVSAGGNSSQRTVVNLDEQVAEAIATHIAETIEYRKSSKVQRSLMTKKLREYIKKRDKYTCQICHASTAEQSLLLLEIDHIIPVSKGGLSTEDNLQTLCWKCNRSKSNKLENDAM